jgi:hypothetical protein
MASSEEIYEHTAQALADLRLPNFIGLATPEEVQNAFFEVFEANPGGDPAWLERFSQLVNQFSGGRTTLQRADQVEFSQLLRGIRGPAIYFLLQHRRLGVLANTLPPVFFNESF